MNYPALKGTGFSRLSCYKCGYELYKTCVFSEIEEYTIAEEDKTIINMIFSHKTAFARTVPHRGSACTMLRTYNKGINFSVNNSLKHITVK